MKNSIAILLFIVIVFSQGCRETIPEANFEDTVQLSIYDYLKDNEEQFSSFFSILEAGRIDLTLSAYNPEGNGYTLFLPDNDAVANFINNNGQLSSLDDILKDTEFASAFSRYHVVNLKIHTKDFPFGAFPKPTLSDDYLTVSFVIEEDTSYYKINNQAAIIYPNIELSNGYIHIIESALKPVVFTSYEWLEQNPDFSLFKKAVDLTGLRPLIDFNTKVDESLLPVTLLLESDAIYQQNGINSLDDLINLISPNSQDYTNIKNPFYNFVAYHILSGNLFIDDFEEKATNYNTFSEVPININGLGIDLAINKGKQVFDTLVYQGDTTFIDYIGFMYDESNVLTQSGAIHFIDRIMTQQSPSRANQEFQFYEEPYINQLRMEAGSYLIKDHEELLYIDWSGADLNFIKLAESSPAWGNDYLEITGDFEISYEIPKIVQGKYELFLRADAFHTSNALIEVFVDESKVSGLIDLSRIGTLNSPFRNILLGTVDFSNYETHKIVIKPVIPGRLLWDGLRFEPI